MKDLETAAKIVQNSNYRVEISAWVVDVMESQACLDLLAHIEDTRYTTPPLGSEILLLIAGIWIGMEMEKP